MEWMDWKLHRLNEQMHFWKWWKRGNQMNWDKLVDMISDFVLSMSVVHVIKWYLWVILIDLECLEWKWTTSHSLPISSSSCSSWHANSFEMALWKVKKWDMFIHSIVWVPASSDMIIIRETVETRRNCHNIFIICNLLGFCECWI